MKFNPGEIWQRVREGVTGNPVTLALYVGVVLMVILALANFTWLALEAGRSKENITEASKMRVISQQIAKNSLEAAAGNPEAFDLLEQSRSQFQSALDSVKDEPVADPSVQQQLVEQWQAARQNVDTILNGKYTGLDLHEAADTLSETVPDLQAEYRGMVDLLVQANADSRVVSLAQRQLLLSERILRSVSRVLDGGEGAVVAADAFGQDAARFGQVQDALIEGDEALGVEPVQDQLALDYLGEAASLYDEFVAQSVDEILAIAPEVFQVRAAADELFSASQGLLDLSTQLNQQFEQGTAGFFPSVALGLVFAGAGFVLFVAIIVLRIREERSKQEGGREPAQPGGHSAAAGRTGRSGGWRPDRAGDGNRGLHRCHRRLHQLLHRPVAFAGTDH